MRQASLQHAPVEVLLPHVRYPADGLLLSPMIASAAMTFSSCHGGHALRLRRQAV